MLDKMNRLEKMVTKLSSALEIDEDLLPAVKDAASIALSDLATSVVTEFTSLSGIMARHYALRDGYSEQVMEYWMLMSVICTCGCFFCLIDFSY